MSISKNYDIDIAHKKENEQYPLKLFMKCDKCGNGYTGYVVKKKNKTNSKVHETVK
jgi:site-specific DNA recombinase